MTGDAPKREDASIRRGRAQMQAIVTFMVVLTLAGVTAGIAAGESVLPRIFRLLTTAGFAIGVARGVRWVTILAGLFMIVAAGMCVITMQTFLELSSPIGFAFAAGAVISSAAAFQLLFSPQLKAFQASQREARQRVRTRAAQAEKRTYAERYSAPRKTSAPVGERAPSAERQALGQRQRDATDLEAQRVEVERLAAERELRAEAQREAKRAESRRLALEAAELRERVRAEHAALAAVEQEKHEQRLERLRPTREVAMRVGSALVALTLLAWCWLAWRSAGGRGSGLAPAITGSVTLVAAVFANVGFTTGRFVLLALGAVAFFSGLLGTSWSGTVPAAPWLAQARIVLLLSAALGSAGLAWGLERSAARMAARSRVLRAFFGILLGLVTMGLFSPQVARCTDRVAARFAGCHTRVGLDCDKLPGCRPIAGACMSQCEFARSEDTCPSGCTWHDRRCTYPSCDYRAQDCVAHAACTMKSGSCAPSCDAAATRTECGFAGWACRWVECAGQPEKSCSEFAYDECPEHSCKTEPR